MLTTQQQTYLVFWNVEGNPETIDDLLKVKADTRTCLGDLICESHYDDDEIRHSVYSLSVAKYHNCQILKGENEKRCIDDKRFPHRAMQEELENLSTTKENNSLVFLSKLPIPPTESDEETIKEKLRKLNKPSNRTTDQELICRLTDQALVELYGKLISKNIDNLQYAYPKGEIFFIGGRRECAVWQSVISTAKPTGIHELLEGNAGSKELDLSRLSTCIVSPGDANEGYYCTLTLPEKKLVLYST